MRNPNRIYKFCNELAACWATVPDWRFGQLMINIMSHYVDKTKHDPFFVEDDKMLEFMKEMFKNDVETSADV